MSKLVNCEECGCYINLEFGQYEIAEYAGREGTEEDPRSPGDYDDICDVCCYS